MLNINEMFKGCLNLSEKKLVNSLEEGAKLYGGASKIGNEIYSNYMGNEFKVDEQRENVLGIIVPGSIDVNNLINNDKYVQKVLFMLNKEKMENLSIQGAWVMENGDVVIENNNMIKFNSINLINDLKLLKDIAGWLKVAMKQEAISIIINDGLVIY